MSVSVVSISIRKVDVRSGSNPPGNAGGVVDYPSTWTQYLTYIPYIVNISYNPYILIFKAPLFYIIVVKSNSYNY